MCINSLIHRRHKKCIKRVIHFMCIICLIHIGCQYTFFHFFVFLLQMPSKGCGRCLKPGGRIRIGKRPPLIDFFRIKNSQDSGRQRPPPREAKRKEADRGVSTPNGPYWQTPCLPDEEEQSLARVQLYPLAILRIRDLALPAMRRPIPQAASMFCPLRTAGPARRKSLAIGKGNMLQELRSFPGAHPHPSATVMF